MQSSHEERVKQELRAVGVSKYGILKAEARYLPQLIQQGEHIHAAVYGRTDKGSAMLVATDRRVIFLDKKPLMTMSDEIAYELVGGVGISQEAGLFVEVTLHTRLGDYVIRFASPKSARTFEQYIGKVRLEGSPQPDSRRTTPNDVETGGKDVSVDTGAQKFLGSHNIGVLSTVDRAGNVSGATVYYLFDSEKQLLYLLTRSDTKKTHNILATHQVAFTVYDEPNLQTIQLQGVASMEVDHATKQKVFDQISQPKQYNNGTMYPPVTRASIGGYIVFKITIQTVKFSEFSSKETR